MADDDDLSAAQGRHCRLCAPSPGGEAGKKHALKAAVEAVVDALVHDRAVAGAKQGWRARSYVDVESCDERAEAAAAAGGRGGSRRVLPASGPVRAQGLP